MNYVRHLNKVLDSLLADHRILPRHIGLYMVLFHMWNKFMFANPLLFVRQEIMPMAKIGSVNTFIKTIKELDTWGYVKYSPSKSAFQPSNVTIITFDNSGDNTTDTSSNNTHDNRCGTSSDDSTNISTNNSSDNGTGKSTDNTGDNSFYKLLNSNKKTITNNNKPLINNLENAHEEVLKNTLESEKKDVREKQKDVKGNFQKPVLSEIEIFFQGKNIGTTEAKKFFNHFESNGWKVGGKSPMKDWKAAARNWILNISRYGQKPVFPENASDYLSTNNDKDYGEPL